jgi:hypothetical protein
VGAPELRRAVLTFEAIRLRAAGLVRSLEEASENALHRHVTGAYHKLDPKLRAAHMRAKDASHLVDHFAKNWPEGQKRFLHQKAAEEHHRAATKLHAAGFADLAHTHMQWAHTHSAHAAQHQHEELVQLPPKGGHSRSGHTLPEQPPSVQHYGDVSTSAPSARKAQQNDQSWNDRTGGYQEIPDSARKLQTRAETVSKSVDRISLDPNFSDEERANHHRTAAGRHIAAAEELLRHGFKKQADRHMMRAQTHTSKAGKYDAVSQEKLKKRLR